MANTDPFWCHEHKCYILACTRFKHTFETDESYALRREVETRPPHPECPSCRCQPFTEVSGWK